MTEDTLLNRGSLELVRVTLLAKVQRGTTCLGCYGNGGVETVRAAGNGLALVSAIPCPVCATRGWLG